MNNFRDDVKGVILAGGSGTRLYPLTKIISKQLLHIYDKPMIYYPLSVLVNSGVRCIMIITTPEDQNSFKDLLGNGSQWGIEIEYATQKKPEGIAQALIISEEWVDKNKTILMLGDNLFFGPNLNNVIRNSIDLNDGATIFGYRLQIRNVLEYFNLMKIIMFFPLKKNQKILNQIGRLLVYIYMMIRLGHMQEN